MPNKLVFLKTEQDFSNFKKSRSLVSANFRILWHVQQNQNIPRFGFIVPKKTLKKVTDRNLIKRRVKSILDKYGSRLKPVDVLFFPKASSVRLTYGELEQELVGNFKKAGLL